MNAKGFRFKQADIGKFKSHDSDIIAQKIKGNDRIMGLTMGKFSLIDLIHSILKVVGKSDVIVATWSAGIKDVHQVKWLLDTGLINNITIVTDQSYKKRQARYAMTIEELVGKENIRTTEIHAKFVLIKNENFKICIRTSMNLNANPKCENFEIDNDSEIYDFYFSFIESMFKNQKEGFADRNFREINSNLKKFFAEDKEQPEIQKQWWLN